MLIEGRSWPLGAHCDEHGVNFALFSENATAVELCLFDDRGERETQRLALPSSTNGVWHGYLPGIGAGQVYGYRVHGPYQPLSGHRFNANKLLLDPYTRRLQGELIWNDANYGYTRGHADADLSFDKRDSAPFVPKSVVTTDRVRQERSHAPHRVNRRFVNREPLSQKVIYEGHVKGLTARMKALPAHKRGTYSALSSKAMISYLQSMGISVLELLPIHTFLDDDFLVERDLVNYWGYQSLCFFAPAARYAQTDNVIQEFRETVRGLHKAGIEVLLDVVYNHTAEGNELGPTLCYRGIDNATYYRLDPNPRFYINDSGTGNTLALEHPRVLQLVMDSLRYWVVEMQVDGYRFDLASILGREKHGFDRGAGFFDAIAQDPALADTRLIAEPWDLGPGGYQLGQYPAQWSEWNDQFRDVARRFWNSDDKLLPEFSDKLLGSSSLFEWQGKSPAATVNFITAHDGFTLNDLVSYREKHNLANGENNKDGHGDNHSNNYGVEGETNDPDISAIRIRQQKNLLCTLFVSQGSPMLLAGDERGRTQNGNNNAYCQDNEITWLNWTNSEQAKSLSDFTQALISLRNEQPVLRRPWYLHGDIKSASNALPDVSWLNSNSGLMSEADWQSAENRFVALQLIGDAIPAGFNEDSSDTLLLLINGGNEDINFSLESKDLAGERWELLIQTADTETSSASITGSQWCPWKSMQILKLLD